MIYLRSHNCVNRREVKNQIIITVLALEEGATKTGVNQKCSDAAGLFPAAGRRAGPYFKQEEKPPTAPNPLWGKFETFEIWNLVHLYLWRMKFSTQNSGHKPMATGNKEQGTSKSFVTPNWNFQNGERIQFSSIRFWTRIFSAATFVRI